MCNNASFWTVDGRSIIPVDQWLIFVTGNGFLITLIVPMDMIYLLHIMIFKVEKSLFDSITGNLRTLITDHKKIVP